MLHVFNLHDKDDSKTKGVENLSSPGCNEINVMSLFNTIPRTKRSHGHKTIQHPNVKKSSKPRTLQDTFNTLISLHPGLDKFPTPLVLEMTVPIQGHYGFHSFPVVD
jgi:hypothetical protein